VVYYPAGFKLKYLLELESIVQTIVPTVGNWFICSDVIFCDSLVNSS
jgi:hypothetical protein